MRVGVEVEVEAEQGDRENKNEKRRDKRNGRHRKGDWWRLQSNDGDSKSTLYSGGIPERLSDSIANVLARFVRIRNTDDGNWIFVQQMLLA